MMNQYSDEENVPEKLVSGLEVTVVHWHDVLTVVTKIWKPTLAIERRRGSVVILVLQVSCYTKDSGLIHS